MSAGCPAFAAPSTTDRTYWISSSIPPFFGIMFPFHGEAGPGRRPPAPSLGFQHFLPDHAEPGPRLRPELLERALGEAQRLLQHDARELGAVGALRIVAIAAPDHVLLRIDDVEEGPPFLGNGLE